MTNRPMGMQAEAVAHEEDSPVPDHAAGIFVTAALTVEDYQEVTRKFCVPLQDEVFPFLAGHSFLIPLLHEAYAAIAVCFPDAPVYLEVLTDPESPTPKLLAAIAPGEPPPQAIAQFDQLADVWWRQHWSRGQGALEIILHYR